MEPILVETSGSRAPSCGLVAERVRFDLSELGSAFPFHVIFDRELRVLGAGATLARLVPRFGEGARLDQELEGVRKPERVSLAPLEARPRAWLLVRARRLPRLVLQGQVLRDSTGDTFMFVASPRVSLEDMNVLGLTLSDFAPPDALGDLLDHMEKRDVSRGDAGRLSDELCRQNGALEQRVVERTAELETANTQLTLAAADIARTLRALEEANARLEREMSERERVEAELRLAHRLEAVGQLAAGIAHEINTPIQYVGDSLYFLQDAFRDLLPLIELAGHCATLLAKSGESEVADRIVKLCEEADTEFLLEQVPKALQRTFDGVDRVASIVRAMKAFAHPGSDERQPADINAALEDTLVVSRNEYKYVADVETDFGDLPPVVCSIGEINQVVLNLIVNAAHAIESVVGGTDGRGTIRIQTSTDVAEGSEWAVLRIQDTGTGIPENIQNQIFDPFFTTKPVGKGTGQGLTLARNIVVKHGGSLKFETEMGKGTTFIIRLPIGTPPHGTDSNPLR